MSVREEWGKDDMAALARAWLAEIRSGQEPTDGSMASTVTLMNFTAPAEVQWTFLKAAVEAAETDEELGAIAAGPFEHLLGFHGDDYIALVERRSEEDPSFARMTTGAWQHEMSEEVWSRVQAIQAGFKTRFDGQRKSPFANAWEGRLRFGFQLMIGLASPSTLASAAEPQPRLHPARFFVNGDRAPTLLAAIRASTANRIDLTITSRSRTSREERESLVFSSV